MVSRFDLARSLNIVDVIRSSGIEVNRYNKFICPFHDDHEPSASIDQHKNRFKCFVCGAGGSTIDFYSRLHNISPVNAVNTLLDGNIKKVEIDPNVRIEDQRQKDQLKNMTWKNSRSINAPSSEEGRNYLTSRGLGDVVGRLNKDIIQIAYNDYKGFKSIIYRFKKHDFIIQKSISKEEGGRRFVKNHGNIKPVPYKEYDHNKYMIVEGIEDGLTALKLGYNFICLNSINNINQFLECINNNIDWFKDQRLILCLDNDTAGDNATNKIKTELSFMGLKVYNSKYRRLMTKHNAKDLNDVYKYIQTKG